MRRFVAAIMLALALAGLAACTAGTADTASAPIVVAPASPIEVYPATTPQGVDPYGTSVQANPPGTGLKYKCKLGETSIEIPFDGWVIRDDATITFHLESYPDITQYAYTSGNSVGEKSVTVTFKGALSFAPISLIVETMNVHTPKDGASVVTFEDELVVDLSPDQVGPDGIKLNTTDFTPGYIISLTLCGSPSKP